MVRVVGPLHSDRASGQFARAMVYSRTLGQDIVRRYASQNHSQRGAVVESARVLTTFSQVFKVINRLNLRSQFNFVPIKLYFGGLVKPGQYWYHVLSELMFGKGFVFFRESLDWFASLSNGQRLEWDGYSRVDLPGLFDPLYSEGFHTIGEVRAVLEWGFFRGRYVPLVIPSDVGQLFPTPAGGFAFGNFDVVALRDGGFVRGER